MGSTTDLTAIDRFIARWAASSGQERANFQLFAAELCDILEVPRPDPAQEDGSVNDYTFERRVEFKEPDGATAIGRIDLYKRSSFVMEAKQSREKGRPKELALAGAPDVERLVVVTVLEPLRREWAQVQATAERLKEEDRTKDAIGVVRTFHETLCATRVLDPACGTGNFLYVSMELMKRLEGEVLEALVDLGGQETLALEKQTVDPHQFLGIELNRSCSRSLIRRRVPHYRINATKGQQSDCPRWLSSTIAQRYRGNYRASRKRRRG